MKKKIDISKFYSLDVLKIINESCDLAYSMKHRICNPYHVFEKYCSDENLKERISKLGIDCSKLEAELQKHLKNTRYDVQLPQGKVYFSPELKKVLYDSYFLSKRAGKELVGIEDFFQGLIRDSGVRGLFNDLGLSLPGLERSYESSYPQAESNVGQSNTISLIRVSQNLSEKAEKGTLDRVVNREAELSQIKRVLVRSSKNNIILLGEAGVGKSAIVELLAQRIADSDVSEHLRATKVFELNITALISLISMRNFQDISEGLQEELNKQGRIIMYIRNFDLVSDEFNVEKTIILNLLKSFFVIKNVRFILSMNTGAYRKLMSKEQSFVDQFETVKVAEPSIELAEQILQKVAERLSKFHKIDISKDVIDTSVNLSKRYIQDRFLPAKAIDILDETCSGVVLEGRNSLTVDDVKKVISEKTGIPIEKLTESEQEKLIRLEEDLNSQVIGQNDAIHTISEVVRRSRAGLKDPKKPIGSFLFLGPSGVGKTYLAKNLAKLIYDDENAMIRLDMSEFSESHTVQRLVGSPPGYVGYEEGGQLTNPVWERPYSLILLDEIEKANMKVFDMFLQVLDEGRLTDGQGRTVDFKNTIIIATSNIASEEILLRLTKARESKQNFDRKQFLESEILPLLKDYFRPEFINRFDEIVIFNPLGIDELAQIARLQIMRIQERLQDKKIRIEVSNEKLVNFAQRGYKPAFGARPIIRLIQDEVENVIARKILSNEIKEGDTVYL